MDEEKNSLDIDFNRREVLKTTSLGIGGSAFVGTVSGRETSDYPEPSVTFEDQTTDGTEVIVAEVATDRDVFLTVRGDVKRGGGQDVTLAAGEQREDVTVELHEPLKVSDDLTVWIYDEETGTDIAGDTATITVEDPPEYIDGKEPTRIAPDPDAGFNYPYFLYAPERTEDEDTRPVLVEPNNTGTPTDEFQKHLDAAEDTVESGTGREIADRLSAPFLVPAFPRPRSDPVDWQHYVHALDDTTMKIEGGDLERVDLQLLSMVEDARERLAEHGYPVGDGLLLNGFSASGNFVERFATLHPEQVTSVSAGGLNGMPILPIGDANGRTLNYPVGIENAEELTGKPFNRQQFCEVNRFLYMGEFDSSDTIPYNDAFTDSEIRDAALDVYGNHMIDDRFPYAQRVYDEVDSNAVFRMYEGENHVARPAVDDIVAFHQRTLADEDIEEIRTDLGGNTRELGAHIEYAPRSPTIGDEVTFDASRSGIRDGDLVEFEWEFGGEEAATGSVVTHPFETAGGHNVTLTATDSDGNVYRTVEQVVVDDTEAAALPKPSVTIDDQSSDGSSVVIADVATNTPVTLVIRDETRRIGGPVFFEAGETAEDVTVKLGDPTPGTRELFVSLYEREFRSYIGIASDTAQVTIDEPRDEGTGPKLIEADSDAGFNYPYYLYEPPRFAGDDPMPLLVEPNNTGTPTDNFDRHREAAKETIEGGIGRRVSDRLSAPLLVPVFPRPRGVPVDSSHYVHQLDDTTMKIEGGDLERVDLQLLSMVEDARGRLADRGSPAADGLMLNGFSASGNFVDRFATLHPDEVTSVTAGGLNGMSILPLEDADGEELAGRTLNYHVGIDDVEELIGEPFDLEAFREVDRFLYMGEIDMNDTIPGGGSWSDEALEETALDVYGRNMQEERFPYCRAAYDEVDASAVFRMYERTPHDPTPAEAAILEFHQRSLAGDDIEDIRSDLGGNVPNRRAAVEYAPRVPMVGEQVALSASKTEIRNRDIVDIEWRFDGEETASGAVLTRAFETRGEHTVTLTVTDDAGDTYRATEYVTVAEGTEEDSDSGDDEDDGGDEETEDDRLTVAFTYEPESPDVEDTVVFDAGGSGPTDRISSYEWDFTGDGSVDVEGKDARYSFDEAGEHEITLTVIDEEDNSKSVTETVVVREGCFIATAACGTPDHPQVEILRTFRDTTLKGNLLGEWIIRCYYASSPPIADWIAESERRRVATRALIVRPAARLASLFRR